MFFPPRVSLPGVLSLVPLPMKESGLFAPFPRGVLILDDPLRSEGAGLDGLLGCQNCLNSLLSSWPIELVLLQPRDVELLPAAASLELTRDVLFVVPHNLRDDTRGRYTFRALSDQEHSALFDRLVDIVAFAGTVRKIVVGYVVNLVLLQELDIDDPRTIFNDLVYPSTIPFLLCVSVSPVTPTIK
ncbi:hypothetical protein KC359_g175 [Hortaea werneckii]|nr:hypothetical protein KC359_g175 [Hortaea werneckii]KAI7514831.1 hypothetical protein KC347_g166 [Hortaea werneckii]